MDQVTAKPEPSGVAGRTGPRTTRSGFIALAGRPNVGKSTLTNAIVGAKVAIVSDKPQTTRRAIRGVATAEDWQLVLIDLPGVQRPRDALTGRMQRRVERELEDADGCLLVVNVEQGIGPGDRFIANLLRGASVPVVVAVNKIDRCDRATTAAALQAVADLEVGDGLQRCRCRCTVAAVDLVHGDHHRHRCSPEEIRDEAIPGPDPLLDVDDEQAAVGVLELALDATLHPPGKRVARTLDAGEVDEHELPVLGRRDAPDRAAGRLRLI